MKKQAFNLHLPGYEYIPGGKPHVFDGRIYAYGSHSRSQVGVSCLNGYVCWSASVDDLGNWRYEDIIYHKNQDPKNKLGLRILFAPDVARGANGRYYLYYAFNFVGMMGVAVYDTPAGEYRFLGHMKYRDGIIWGRRSGDSFPFDLGVLADDDGRVYLYSGFYEPVPGIVTGKKQLKFEGSYVPELGSDMVTIRTPAKLLFPKKGPGIFPGHEFFEASSTREYEGKYYFVYSSKCDHELCYAVSDRPDGGFTYGGVLVGNCDVGVNGIIDESHVANYVGNNHGGMLCLNGQYYIFYHRHTCRTSYSRQTCVKPLRRDTDGSSQQTEMISCGLDSTPLRGKGCYEARIAYNLWCDRGTRQYDVKYLKKRYAHHPYFTQNEKDDSTTAIQYIADMGNGAVASFKYFAMEDVKPIHLEVKGTASGNMLATRDREFTDILAEVPAQLLAGQRKVCSGNVRIKNGVFPLYFKYVGKGTIDFIAFALGTEENG